MDPKQEVDIIKALFHKAAKIPIAKTIEETLVKRVLSEYGVNLDQVQTLHIYDVLELMEKAFEAGRKHESECRTDD